MNKCFRCGNNIYDSSDAYKLCLCSKYYVSHDEVIDELVLEIVSDEYMLCELCKEEAINLFEEFMEQETEDGH